MSRLGVLLRLSGRELRGGIGGFRIFIACIALGVAAIAAVGSMTRSISAGLASEGRVILGGDVAVSFGSEPPGAAVLAQLETRGAVSMATLVNSMARRADGGGEALVRIKAVDAAYPLVGVVAVAGAPSLRAGLAPDAAGRPGVAIEPLLADRLGLSIGDPIVIGRLTARVGALITDEPDKAGTGVAFGPRVLMDEATLAAADLIQPGSLVQRLARLRLADGATDAAVTAAKTDITAAFPAAGWRISTRLNAAPGLERNVERFSEFLTLVGLTALVVGGVGVTNAVKAFIDRKRRAIATLKSLGAEGGFVVGVYLVVLLAITAVGVAIGLLVGLLPPLLAGGVIARAFDLPLRLAVYPRELVVAALYGFTTALTFALWTLGRAHDVPASALFRAETAADRRWPRRRYGVAAAALAALLVTLALATASDRFVAAVFVVAMAGVFILLVAIAHAIMWGARQLPTGGRAELRLAIRNIHRPGGLTLSVVLSLGLGLTLMVALTLIDIGLRHQLTAALPERAPNVFVLDIRSDEAPAFARLVEAAAPGADLQSVPLLRGRITALNGVPVDRIEAPEGARWALDGDRGITSSPALPANSTLATGTWWPADYGGEPLVSFEDELARNLGLKVGDSVAVSVLGRPIIARIASTRHVEWASLAINFVMVFSPNTFAGAPYSVLSTIALAGGGDRAGEARLFKAIVDAYPTATVVRVKDVLATLNDLVGTLIVAVRAAASIALVAAVLVLAGALASGHRRRLYDAVLLKTLGATRRRVLAAFVAEYAALGLVTALFALLAGGAAATGVLVGLMKVAPVFDLWASLGAVALALVLTVGLGLAGTWRVLGAKAAPVLRNL